MAQGRALGRTLCYFVAILNSFHVWSQYCCLPLAFILLSEMYKVSTHKWSLNVNGICRTNPENTIQYSEVLLILSLYCRLEPLGLTLQRQVVIPPLHSIIILFGIKILQFRCATIAINSLTRDIKREHSSLVVTLGPCINI